MLRRGRRLEKLPFAEIIFFLEMRRVRISGATLLETRQNVKCGSALSKCSKTDNFRSKKKMKTPDLTRSSCRALPLYRAVVKGWVLWGSRSQDPCH